MKGSIYTTEKCSECGKTFKLDESRGGLFCPDHHDCCASKSFRVHFGRKIKKRFTDYDTAIRFLTGLRFKEDEGTLDLRDYKADNPLSVQNQIDKYLGKRKGEMSHNGYREVARYLIRASQAWGNRNIKTIGFADIEDFLDMMQTKPKTKANARSAFHAFFTWVNRREGIPVPDMPEVEYSLGWRNIISLEKQATIINEVRRIAPVRVWIGIKWLATYVAIRPAEMRQLRERDIDVNGMIVCRPDTTKERKVKIVAMLQEDVTLFRAQVRGLPDMPFFRHIQKIKGARMGAIFGREYLYTWWKRACDNIGVVGVDLYAGTRHSSVSAMANHFSRDEIKAHGSMHSTNAAFERYMQSHADPSRSIYEKIVQERKEASRLKVVRG